MSTLAATPRSLQDAARAAGASLDLPTVLQRVVALLAEATGAAEACLYLYDEETRELALAAATTPVAAEHVDVARIGLGEGVIGWVAAAREAYAADGRAGGERAPGGRAARDGERGDALVCVPVVGAGERLIGVAAAWAQPGRPLGADGARRAEQVVALVAGAIDNARLHAASARSARAVDRVAEVAAITTAGVATARVIEVVTALARDVCRAEVAATLVADPSGGDLLTVAHAGPPASPEQRQRVQAARRELAAVDEQVRRGGSSWHAAADDIGCRLRPWLASVATAPLRVAGEELGVICCYAPEGRRPSAADQSLLATIASQAALALKNAALAAEVVQQQNEFGRFVRDIASGRLDASATRAQAAALGFDPARRHCVVVGSLATAGDSQRDAERRALVLRQIAQILAELSADARCVAGARDAVALLAARDDEAWLAELRAKLTNLRDAVRERTGALVTFGLARASCAPGELRSALTEAREVASLGVDGTGVFTRDDVSHQLLLRRAADVASAGDRHACAIETLAEYDRVNGSALLETLAMFLHLRSRSDAARALYVHRNTLAQRLRRIEELTDVRVSDADEWFPLQLALKLHELRTPGGRPTAPPPPSPSPERKALR